MLAWEANALPLGNTRMSLYFIAFFFIVKYNSCMRSSKRFKDTLIFFKERTLSFKNAFEGFVYALKTQKNAWIHAVITIFVLVLSFLLKLNLQEWVPILIVIAMVWMAELLNTALESIVDIICPETHPLAKIAKDVGAAFVLIAAALAVVIGCIVFIPKLIEIILVP